VVLFFLFTVMVDAAWASPSPMVANLPSIFESGCLLFPSFLPFQKEFYRNLFSMVSVRGSRFD